MIFHSSSYSVFQTLSLRALLLILSCKTFGWLLKLYCDLLVSAYIIAQPHHFLYFSHSFCRTVRKKAGKCKLSSGIISWKQGRSYYSGLVLQKVYFFNLFGIWPGNTASQQQSLRWELHLWVEFWVGIE